MSLSPEASDPSDGPHVAVDAPLTGTVVSLLVEVGDPVLAGRPVAILESMKMEHEVHAPVTGLVAQVATDVGSTVTVGDRLLVVREGDVEAVAVEEELEQDPDAIRSDLAEVLDRQARTQDAARREAVAKRHSYGHRTARENLADLCDPGTFTEYGALAVAAQRDRRSLDELIANTPADGLIGGLAQVNGRDCVVMSYDYTVLAGTQGYYGHHKLDRLFELTARLRRPLVLFAEGGGGRPGDTSAPSVSGLEVMAFALFGRLSGLVPLVGVVSGRCFAGNAALLGCCDVIIATEDASIGMAGPAMIEGGGLGRVAPDDVGPTRVQNANGVIDVLVADEAEAVAVARRYLSYFQGPVEDWDCADQRELRRAIPEDRLRVYDVRRVIAGLADTDSVLELRAGWAPGIVTALARLGGRPVGLIANNPGHLGGAIDADGADKAARFLQLCDAFDIPVVFLCDTPGFMVGPEAEKSGQVRHFARMFVVGGSITVPYVTVILRKGYGLGAQAMAGGSFRTPALTVAWPTGEIGGMGLEGAVRLGFRRELDAEPDDESRRALEERLIAAAYRNGKALNAATHFEIDDVIDPATTRDRILAVLAAAPEPAPRTGKKRPCVDTW
ncbi:MAG TPA: carboxyl transferase domain-containing protein [Acidimicrobiales bacterium]|nr:carboxyl transferase domain-containing protein [Acidimicrobiales bacterium]